MPKILVVDDDPDVRELLTIILKREGFLTFEAMDGIEALLLLEKVMPDLVVIDVMMPNLDGWSLCEMLREHYNMPIMMLTAKGETEDKLKGFRVGTDDYMTKPFEPLEFVARIKALLKRYQISISMMVQIGNLTLRRAQFDVFAFGQSLVLPPKEFELLFLLGSHPNKTFTREQLIEQIWGVDYEGDQRTVDVHIRRIRERFPEETSKIRILTIRFLGYRLEVIP